MSKKTEKQKLKKIPKTKHFDFENPYCPFCGRRGKKFIERKSYGTIDKGIFNMRTGHYECIACGLLMITKPVKKKTSLPKSLFHFAKISAAIVA